MADSRIPQIRVLQVENLWKNHFDSDSWVFFDPFNRKFFTEEMNICDVNDNWNIKYREWILYVVGDGFTGVNGSVQAKFTVLATERVKYRRFCQWGSKNYPNVEVKNFTSLQVNEFFSEIFHNPIGKTKIGVMALKSLTAYAASLNKLSVSFSLGKISDGISDRSIVPNGKRHIPPFFQQLVKSANIDEHDWVEGSTFGSIPIYIAMAFLGHSIEVIQSSDAKLVTQMFRWAIQFNSLTNGGEISQSCRVRKLFSFIQAYNELKLTGMLSLPILQKLSLTPLQLKEQLVRKNKYIQARYHKEASHEDALKVLEHKTGHRSNATKVWQYDYDVFLLVEKTLRELYPNGNIKIQNSIELKQFVSKTLRPAVLTILLCLTGARSWSEIAKMTFGDVEYEFGKAKYTTPITKTNHGIPATRFTTNLAYDAIEILRGCILEENGEPVKSYRSVFTGRAGRFSLHTDNYYCLATRPLMQSLSDYYVKFAEKHPQFYAQHHSLSAHQFRHTWAEFTLRRFEGDVQEVIRIQFMHSMGSEMANRYSLSKLEPETRDSLVRQYLKEVLFNIGMDYVNNESHEDLVREFQGKAIQVMNQSLKSQVIVVEDIPKWVESQSHDYIQIQAHEYGYCLLHVDYIEHAKCYDDTTSLAMVGAASFSDCSGCVNFAAHRGNHLAGIKRQAIAHQSNISRLKIRFPHFTDNQPLIKASNNMVIKASQIIGRWKI